MTLVLLCTSITKKNIPVRSSCWYKENTIQAEFFIVFAFSFSLGHERILIGPELWCVLMSQVARAWESVSTVQGGEWGHRDGRRAPLARYPTVKCSYQD